MSELITPVALRPRINRAAPRSTRTLVRVGRWIIAVAMIAAGAAIVASEAVLRTGETQVLAWLIGHTYGDSAIANTSLGQPTATFNVGAEWYALRVTVQCAIAFYLGPVALLGGLLSLAPKVRIHRMLIATVIGMVGLMALNQLRLLMIGFAFSTWGREGFNWAHGPIGTVLMLVGIAAVLLLFFVLCLKPSKAQKRAELEARDAR